MFYDRTGIRKVYMGKFNKGDDIIPALEKFSKENKIKKAFIQVIGAVQTVTLGYYDQVKQKYLNKSFKIPMEISSMSGNVSIKDKEIFIHLHGVFSKKDFSSIGGHLISPSKIFAGEFVIFELKGKGLIRKFNPPTGLHLWE